MAVTAEFHRDLSRVRVSFTGVSPDADYAIVERSKDGGYRWETVRGGSKVPVTAGAGRLDDYEFLNGVPNIYRVTAVDSQPQAGIGSGGPVTATGGGSLTPACAGDTRAGDLVLLLATIRYDGAAPVRPAGWDTLVDLGNVAVFARYATEDGSVGQTVAFEGPFGPEDDTTAQMTTFRNTSIAPAGTPAVQVNVSAQDIAWPGATPAVAGTQVVLLGWKQHSWTSAPVPSYRLTAELGQVAATAGNAAGHVWWTTRTTSAEELPAGHWTVTGGTAAVSKAALVFLPPKPFTSSETAEVTPAEDRVVLVNLGRPSLNLYPETISVSGMQRKSRAGIFSVQGRTNPVAVTDVHSSREFTVDMDIIGFDEQDDIDLKLASGQPVYLRVPENQFLPECYVSLGDYEIQQDAKASRSMTVSVAMTEIARPGDSVHGDTFVWADVITDYGQWLDVLSTPVSATWTNLIDRVGSSEVIVG